MKLKLILPQVSLVMSLFLLSIGNALAGASDNNVSIEITPPGSSGVVFTGEEGTVKVKISKGNSSISIGDLTINCEFDAGTKKNFKFPVSFSAASEADETFTIPTDNIGYWQINADFTSSGESASAFSGVAIVEKIANYDATDPQSFFGSMLVNDFEAANRMGCKIDRQMAIWAFIENEKGVYRWSPLDKLVSEAEKHNVSVLVDIVPNLTHGNKRIEWASWHNDYDLLNEPNLGYYKAFLTALVSRYKGKLAGIEILNEPDLEFFRAIHETQDHGVEFVKKLQIESYKIIKSIDPDMPVIGCSLSGRDLRDGSPFFKSTLESSGETSLDIFGGHAYSPGRLVDEEHPPGYPDQYDLAGEINSGLNIMRSKGMKPRFWGTEIGYAYKIGTLPLSDAGISVAAGLAQTLITAKSVAGAEKLFWFVFSADKGVGPDAQYNFSLIYSKNVPPFPYPSVSAYATSARLLHHTTPAGSINIKSDIIAKRFTSDEGAKTIVALWCKSGTYNLKVQGSNTLHIFNMFGGEEKAASNSTFKISRNPTYFVFPSAESPKFD